MGLLQAITTLVIVTFACAEGFTHAILYSRKGEDSFSWNEHWVFSLMRVLLAVAAILPGEPLVVMSALCMYPFFHNGMYYTQRDRIDGSYPKRWWDMTSGSSARTNFTVVQRTMLAGIGLIFFVLILIFGWSL